MLRVLALHLASCTAAIALFAAGAAYGLGRETATLASLIGAAKQAWPASVAIAPVAVGAWLLCRQTRPLAGAESQLVRLARAPHGEEPRLQNLPAGSCAAVGWNRLARRLENEQARAETEGPRARLAQLARQGGGRARAALQSLSEGVAVTDAEGRIDFANRAIEALLGADGELEGASLDGLLAEACPGAAEKLANQPTEAVAEIALAEAGRTLRVERAALRGDDAGAVWCVRDVTQQKLAEAARDQFIDTATHELRTPLANIKAYAETLAMGSLSDVEQQKEFCNTINTEATRLSRFVDDLLSISSLEVGSMGVERQNVDVRRLLDEAAAKVRPLAEQKKLSFEVELAEKLGEASLDKDKVSGMVVNLLGNAVKYTPSGGTVTLAAKRHEEELRIDVRDTGVGIATEEQDKVFDKFFRSENPDVQDQVGTGLGLSLAREIARLHRGELTLTSRVGEGSTFSAVLPVT